MLELAGLTATPITVDAEGKTSDQPAPPFVLRCRPPGAAANRIWPPAVGSTSTTPADAGRFSGVHVEPASLLRNSPAPVRTSTESLLVMYNLRAGPARPSCSQSCGTSLQAPPGSVCQRCQTWP